MSQHNYTNPAFCQSSEFYPVPSAKSSVSNHAHTDAAIVTESIYNRSLNLNFNALQSNCRNPREGPLRIQRSMSTRSFVSQANATMRKTPMPNSHQQQQQRTSQQDCNNKKYTAVNLQFTTAAAFEPRSGSGRYALVPVEELSGSGNKRYAIVPGSSLMTTKRYTKSQDDLDRYAESRERLQSDDEPHSFHEDTAGQGFSSLPPVFGDVPSLPTKRRHFQRTVPPPPPPLPAKIKHAFSSDFGSKSFLIVDKHSNQRYQMVPTAEDEELVDENQEIIQMHNGRAHRYAVIPTDDDEEETCLSTSDLNQSQNLLALNYEPAHTTLRTSTPQKGVSMANLASTSSSSYPNTPLKNPAATKMLHELLSTPRKTPMSRSAHTTPRNGVGNLAKQPPPPARYLHHQSQQQIYYAPATAVRKKELSPQRLHYETIKCQAVAADRTMAVISPRVAGGCGSGTKVYPQMEEDCSDIHGKSGLNNNSYPEKVANATITLAVVSLMLVLGSTMNSGLIIYMIAHVSLRFFQQN